MIELAFSESFAGALKLAKSMQQGERLTGAIAVFGGTRKEQREAKMPRNWAGITMEGSAKDVEVLTLDKELDRIEDFKKIVPTNKGIFK
jgi:hypothetical protein